MKALSPIVVTVLGICTFPTVEFWNAEAPIVRTPDGMLTNVTAELANAFGPIAVVPVLSETAPVHPVLPVITPEAMVYEPPPGHGTTPSVALDAGGIAGICAPGS